jgi:4-amino-4-deoxy-L-arabinose transferase-like glycosyltransferase
LLLIIAVGAAVRFVALGSQSLWADEVVTREVVTGPISGLLTRVRLIEGTPPLYFGLTAVWTRLIGTGDGALRSLSAVAGTLAIPVVYATVRELRLSRRIARVAAVLVAVNPFLVWYSQEARAYSLFVFLAAVSIWAFARARTRRATIDFLWFGLASAAMLATHYFAVFLLIPMIAALLIASPRTWRRLLTGLIPLAVTAVPLGVLALDQRSHNGQAWITQWSLEFRLREAARHFSIGPSAPNAELWIVVAGVAIFGMGCAVALSDRAGRRDAVTMIAIGLAALLLPAMGAGIGGDYFLDRNVIVALLPLTVAVAIGLGGLRARWIGLLAVATVIAVSLVTTVAVVRDPDLQRADWRQIAHRVVAKRGAQVVVMNTGNVLGQALHRYLPPERVLGSHQVVAVHDVAFIGLEPVPGRCDWWFGRACSSVFLSAEPPAQFPTSFQLVARDHVGHFVVARYRSPQRVNIGPGTLVTRHDLPGSLVSIIGEAQRSSTR